MGSSNQQRLVTDRGLEADLGIPKTTVSEILMQDLGMKHVGKIHFAASATRAEEYPAVVANDLIQTATNEPHFLKKVITRDELWVHGYDPK